MKRFILAPSAALFVLMAVGVVPAAAQNTYPYMPPRFGPGYQTQLSPYLRMLIPGDQAINYFSLVLPEFQRRQDRNQFQMQIQGLTNLLPPRPGITDRDIDTPLPSTGHPTAFGYTGTYFGGINQFARGPSNPFGPRQGQGRFPYNAPQPAGKAPQKPK
jgi:hypothetical protein